MNLGIPPRDDCFGDQRQFEEERDSKFSWALTKKLNGANFINRAFGLTADYLPLPLHICLLGLRSIPKYPFGPGRPACRLPISPHSQSDHLPSSSLRSLASVFLDDRPHGLREQHKSTQHKYLYSFARCSSVEVSADRPCGEPHPRSSMRFDKCS